MKKQKFKVNMRATLILFALIPMLITTILLSVIIINISSKELKESTHNSLVEVITGVGNAFDASVDSNKMVMESFATSPIILEALQNPDDADIAAEAEQYTVDFFSQLSGFEGIYLADWDTKVLTHPNAGAVGMVLREGDALEGLRSAMLSADGGVYNVGIITSPASGQLIMSMYYPIFDGSDPVGFIGAGTYVNAIAEKFSSVDALKLSSAYIYFVDAQGTMLYHPDPEKIGNPVENEAVKTLVARIGAGEHPSPECVEYNYKGAMKYAAYYVDDACNYIAVLTANEDDVLASVQIVIRTVVIFAIICVILCVLVALFAAKAIASPLTKIAEATAQLSTGDVTVTCEATSSIKETVNIIEAFDALKNALQSSIGNVKNSAISLDQAIGTVDDKTAHNVESVSQISVAIDEVAATSQAVAQNAQDMADRAAELGVNVESLTENVSRLHEASVTIKQANSEATECMKSVLNGSDKSVDAIQTISKKISETNDAIVNISNAVQAIETIAAQTNLLSLNASIEAARAGEAGRGFAVVADEIRTLADQSAASAKEIKKTVEDIIALSNETVQVSEEVYEIISAEKNDILTTQERFTVLSDSVDSSIVEIETINSMAKVLDGIKTELANATTDLGAISEELGASAQEVAASCQTVSAACNDTQSSTEEMGSINENMVAAVDFFKID